VFLKETYGNCGPNSGNTHKSLLQLNVSALVPNHFAFGLHSMELLELMVGEICGAGNLATYSTHVILMLDFAASIMDLGSQGTRIRDNRAMTACQSLDCHRIW
jgi:hypothetical protein